MKKALKWFFNSFIWVFILFFAIDLVSKQLVSHLMSEGQSITIIPTFLSITYSLNPGVVFGTQLFKTDLGNRILFIVVASLASIGIIVFYALRYKKLDKITKICLMLILVGALGNLTDRLFYGYTERPYCVVDFIDFFKGGPLHAIWSAIFNIADACIVVSAFTLIIFTIITEVKEAKAKAKNNPKEIKEEKVLSETEKLNKEEKEISK